MAIGIRNRKWCVWKHTNADRQYPISIIIINYIECILIAYRLPIDCLSIAYRLPMDGLLVALDAHILSHIGYGRARAQGPKRTPPPRPAQLPFWTLGQSPGPYLLWLSIWASRASNGQWKGNSKGPRGNKYQGQYKLYLIPYLLQNILYLE